MSYMSLSGDGNLFIARSRTFPRQYNLTFREGTLPLAIFTLSAQELKQLAWDILDVMQAPVDVLNAVDALEEAQR